jgi:hypothetical protein
MIKFRTFISENTDPEYKYMRRTPDPKVIGPYGYALFVEFHGDVRIASDKINGYGKYLWVAKPYHPISAGHLVPMIEKVLSKEEHEDLLSTFHTTAHKLASEANPHNIVNSAGLWDAPELVEIVWNEILDRHGFYSVITHDGMVSFDDQGVTQVKS